MGYEYGVFELLCKGNNVTPYKVAQETGVSTATLSSWKTGRYMPKEDKVQKLADYFGVSIDAFKSYEPNGPVYHIDGKAAKIAQEIFDNPNLRALFNVASDSKPEDVRMATDMLSRFKEKK